MTGFSASVRSLIRVRAGDVCERCGKHWGVEIHHRRPRGMGGTSQASSNAASNGLLLCSDCHRHVELFRGYAIEFGFLVSQQHSPLLVPVYRRGEWVHLDNEGGIQETAA